MKVSFGKTSIGKNYLKIDIHYGNTSISERQRACEYITKNINMKMVNHKITKASIEEALSELICPEKQTSYYALCALCSYYKMKIIIIWDLFSFSVICFHKIEFI